MTRHSLRFDSQLIYFLVRSNFVNYFRLKNFKFEFDIRTKSKNLPLLIYLLESGGED